MDLGRTAGGDRAILGRYELLRPIGQGGAGQVYEAELQGPAGFRKRVAVKVLRNDAGELDAESRTQLVREARLGGLVSHPNVVETYELGWVPSAGGREGRWFVAMALVRGPSLSALLKSGPLPPAATLEVALQATAGVAHLHRLGEAGPGGIVHRDLKPGNVLVDRSGLVRIADLGIAALCAALDGGSDRRGTPAYMAPEQIRGAPLDARCDVFALGTLILECATGRNPFRRATPPESARAVLAVDREAARLVQGADGVPGLPAVLARCLVADPAVRFPDAAALYGALRTLPMPPGDGLRDALERSGEVVHDAPTFSSGPTTHRESNLTAEDDVFVGRDDEQASVLEALAEAPLVTLKGPGGAGKTRLARRCAHAQIGGWPGGIWFCDFTEVRTLDGALHAVASALSVPLGRGDDDVLQGQLAHALAARGRILLVLDNLEQVIDAAARLLQRLRTTAPDAAFLATSRERLQLPGEIVVEVGPLDEDGALALLRARTADVPGWAEAPEDVLRRLVRRLDGLPLAVELAAARARLLKPQQLLDRLGRRLDDLRGGRDRPARHGTLRGAIDWSWNLLHPWEQVALAQLSVFRGGCFLEEVEAVLDLSAFPDAPWAVDVVGSLWDKSLVTSREVQDQPRFSMVDSIREYAVERLDPAERARIELRHARAFAAFSDRPIAARRLAVDLDNLLAAADAAVRRDDWSAALEVALLATRVLRHMGPISVAVQLLERFRAAPLAPADRCRALVALAGVALHAGNATLAETVAREAVDGARAAGQPAQLIAALGGLGECALARGRTDEAERAAVEAVAAAEAAGVASRLGNVRVVLARVRVEQGRLAEAEALLREAEAAARRDRDEVHLTRCVVQLALTIQHAGRFDEARELFSRAHAAVVGSGDRIEAARLAGNQGILERRTGRLREAQRHYESALRAYREIGSRLDEAIVLGNLAILHYYSGRYSMALDHHVRSIEISSAGGHGQLEANSRSNLANLLLDLGESTAALRELEQAIRLFAQGDWRHLLAIARVHLGVARWRLGDAAAAEPLLAGACAVLTEIGDRRNAATANAALATVEFELGRAEASFARLARHRDPGVRQAEANVAFAEARLLLASGRVAEASDRCAACQRILEGESLDEMLRTDLFALVAELRLREGRTADAERALRTAREHCPPEDPARRALLDRLAARLHGPGDAARALLDRALEGFRRADRRLQVAETLLDRATLTSRHEDRDEARAIVASLGFGPGTPAHEAAWKGV